MNTTVIFAHPWEGSLNRVILNKIMDKLRSDGDTINLIDLYRDGFDPVMSKKDLSLYSQGKSADPMVDRYNAILDKTEKIIFQFPIWWYDMPAIMRGFLDKFMLNNLAYTQSEQGIIPVRNIPNTVLITTSAIPTEVLINNFGDPVNKTIINGTFNAIGFFNAKWHNLGNLDRKTKEEIAEFIESIPEMV
jgi:putative NADPH-quinone reductase